MSIGTLVTAAALMLAASVAAAWRHPRVWLSLVAASSACLLAAALHPGASAAWTWEGAFRVGGERPVLRLDGLSAWFLAIVAVIGPAGAAYSRDYWSDGERPDSAGRGRATWSGLMLSMTFVLLSTNGLHFLVAWELFAIGAWLLIILDPRRRDTRAAGWLYLGASHAGTLALFAFFALHAVHAGTWELGARREDVQLAPLFWLVLFGFGIKAGLFPLHVWLPSAHASAPSHVSAMMSAAAIKMGLYGLLRFTGWLPIPASAPWVLLGLGAAGAVAGAAFALAQSDLKRLLAYSSVENIGAIVLGLGMGTAGLAKGAPWAAPVLAGAFLHAWNHALFKALLFFSAGSIVHATGTRELRRLGGLWRVMPWTTAAFATGAVAVSALPMLNGFVSEWLIYLGLFEAGAAHSPAGLAAAAGAIALALTGTLALAAFMKAASIALLGAPRTRAAETAHEGGWWMRAPMCAMAGGCFTLGLLPWIAWPRLAAAVNAWRPGMIDAAPPAALEALSRWQLGLFACTLTAVAVLGTRCRATGIRRAPTWDCGYARPTRRMQYSAGSFSGIVTGWLRGALRPELRARPPSGTFPREGYWLVRVPETILEHGIGPVARVIMTLSAAVRRLQHGRLTRYILYLVAGLFAIGAVVLASS